MYVRSVLVSFHKVHLLAFPDCSLGFVLTGILPVKKEISSWTYQLPFCLIGSVKIKINDAVQTETVCMWGGGGGARRLLVKLK